MGFTGEGDMRRPPELPEQRLARALRSAFGGASGLSGTSTPAPTTPTDTGDGTDPGNSLHEGPLVTPSTPVVTSWIGSLLVKWDGLDNVGNPYRDWQWVEVHAATTSGFTPSSSTLKGTQPVAGTFPLTGLDLGTVYYVKLVGRDIYGGTTTPSAEVSATPRFVINTDIGTGEITADRLGFTPSGGATISYGTSAPTSPAVGDIWLDSTGGYVTQKRWNGTSWAAIVLDRENFAAGVITANEIATGAIVAGSAIIADAAIRDAQIISLDAAKITTGYLDAARINAGTITATHLSSTAIDGKTITGAVIRTSAATRRAEMNVGTIGESRLGFYDSAGNLAYIGQNTLMTRGIEYVANDHYFSGSVRSSGTIDAGALSASGNISSTGGTIYANTGGFSSNSGGVYAPNGTGRFSTVNALSLTLTSGGVDSTGGCLFRSTAWFIGQEYHTDAYGRTVTAGYRAAYWDGDTYRSASTLQSSRRIKRDIAPVQLDVDAVLGLEVVNFRYRAAADDSPLQVGVIAEQAEELGLEWLIQRDVDGIPDYFAYERLCLGLLAVAQRQRQELAELTERVAAIEAA